MRRPSGEGTASRIWRIVKVGVSSIGYSKATRGPRSSSTSTSNGISVGAPPSTGIRQILPPYVAISAFESGVKLIPG